jgi:hypothetical protein
MSANKGRVGSIVRDIYIVAARLQTLFKNDGGGCSEWPRRMDDHVVTR